MEPLHFIGRRLGIFILAAVTVSALSSCKKDRPGGNSEPENELIPINVSTSLWTRATDDGYEENDRVGIYVVNWDGDSRSQLQSSGNHADNALYTFSGGSWVNDTPLYWQDQTTKADFYCYYPYSSAVQDVSAFPFSVNTDQSSDAGYKASDLLWGKTEGVSPTPDPVQITTRHLMSNLLIYLKPGNGYSEETLAAAQKTVIVTGVRTSSTVDLSTGSVTATGDVGEIVAKTEDGYYRALVVPQTLTDTPVLKITVDGYEYTLSQSIAFESNRQHICTVTVNKTGEGIDIGIGDWETDDTDYGGSVE